MILVVDLSSLASDYNSVFHPSSQKPMKYLVKYGCSDVEGDFPVDRRCVGLLLEQLVLWFCV